MVTYVVVDVIASFVTNGFAMAERQNTRLGFVQRFSAEEFDTQLELVCRPDFGIHLKEPAFQLFVFVLYRLAVGLRASQTRVLLVGHDLRSFYVLLIFDFGPNI